MLLVLMGPSGSGKTSISERLKQNGFKAVESYTTRKIRYPNEPGHIFISKEEFERLPNKVAPVCYSGDYYCATLQQLCHNDIYVAEPSAMTDLVLLRNAGKLDFVAIGLNTSRKISEQRMRLRGDPEEKIRQRLGIDETHFSNLAEVCDVMIDNNGDIENAIAEIQRIKEEY